MVKLGFKIPDWVKNNAVTDCKIVEEFASKYRKPSRFQNRGIEYIKVILESHHEDIEKRGYTIISRYETISGKLLTFIP